MLPLLLPTLITAGTSLLGAGMSAVGANRAENAEDERRKAELAEQKRQFDLSTRLGQKNTERGQNMQGFQTLLGQLANAQTSARTRSFRNQLYGGLTGGR
jgi:hypothetical protein